MRLLVATRNTGKLREIRHEMARAGWTELEIVSLAQVGPAPVIPEDQPDFTGNARQKALGYASATGLLTLAEDSGLCVDALDGAPGVRSARYAGEPCDDRANNGRLLGALAGVGAAQRTARFVCAAALARPRAVLTVLSDQLEGVILEAPRGANGFGYDPLFFVPELDRTTAELSLEEKTRFSHRGKALRRLMQWMREHRPLWWQMDP